jgi:tetratricopeptide (TPR) repeat protein
MSRPAKPTAKPEIKKSANSSQASRSKKDAKGKADDWKVLNDRGSDRTIAGKLKSAIADFDAAIALVPKEALPRYNRATAQLLGGDVKGAIDGFTKTIELDPEFVPAYIRRGEARHDLEELDASLADFDAALRLSPDDPDALAQRATVRAELSDFDGAVHDIERALAIAPKDWEMRENADEILVALRKAKETHAKHNHAASALDVHTLEAPKAPATSVIEEALSEAGWPFSREDDGQGMIDYLLPMTNSAFIEAFVMRLSEEFERLVLYVLFHPKAKKEHRGELCEFVARANYGMGDGNFEMDVDEGSVRFRVSLDFTGTALPGPLVRNMIVDAMNTIELYEGALSRVIAGKTKAKSALRAAEQAAMQRGALQ